MSGSLTFFTRCKKGWVLIILFFVSQKIFCQIENNQQEAQLVITVPSCPESKIKEVKAKATKDSAVVRIDCNLTLKSTDTVTKRIILEGGSATGVTIDGGGAVINGGVGTYNYNNKEKVLMLEIRSRKYYDANNNTWKWERPQNITIKHCKIIGAVRVWGMAQTGEGTAETDKEPNHLLVSSRKVGHTGRARNNAPTNINFDNVTITSYLTTPFYLAPGVTHCKLTNSTIKGNAASVSIYLDAESYGNVIKNNTINTVNPREQIAVDGSSYNRIINNKFSGLNHGGIFLYRNCGQDSVIRHATPSYNQIINNIFYYNVYTGDSPSIYLAARDGGKTYCGEDKGYSFGSSVSDLDYAKYNVVMQNQIYKRSVNDMIKTQHPSTNSPNYISNNKTVDGTTVEDRKAGCYVQYGYKTNFILHGQSIDVFGNSNGEPICTGYKYSCSDGELIRSTNTNCNITNVSFNCQVIGSNNGCQKTISCPSGQTIIGAKAAANLEFGNVTETQLIAVPANILKVVKTSDLYWEGSTHVGNNTLSVGQKSIAGINGLTKVSVGCKEQDSNGGDCHIKGILYCYGPITNTPLVKQ